MEVEVNMQLVMKKGGSIVDGKYKYGKEIR